VEVEGAAGVAEEPLGNVLVILKNMFKRLPR
jgi:hypothetical protein